MRRYDEERGGTGTNCATYLLLDLGTWGNSLHEAAAADAEDYTESDDEGAEGYRVPAAKRVRRKICCNFP